MTDAPVLVGAPAGEAEGLPGVAAQFDSEFVLDACWPFQVVDAGHGVTMSPRLAFGVLRVPCGRSGIKLLPQSRGTQRIGARACSCFAASACGEHAPCRTAELN